MMLRRKLFGGGGGSLARKYVQRFLKAQEEGDLLSNTAQVKRMQSQVSSLDTQLNTKIEKMFAMIGENGLTGNVKSVEKFIARMSMFPGGPRESGRRSRSESGASLYGSPLRESKWTSSAEASQRAKGAFDQSCGSLPLRNIDASSGCAGPPAADAPGRQQRVPIGGAATAAPAASGLQPPPSQRKRCFISSATRGLSR
mmetsp:Transcript_25362/g.67996  ORF Transcript_25362/g.67996 Transcript_25362/m.67996 type:complete len:199 (-) Transcript_25362:180-776(-)